MVAKELTGSQVVRLGPPTIDSIPDEPVLTKPAGASTWYKKARLMRRDPTIALVRNLVVAPALAASWSYEAAENAPPGAAEFISNIMEPVRQHIIETSFYGCIDFGWQPFELIFETTQEGKWTVGKFKPLLQDFTEILVEPKTGGYAGLRQEELELDVENTFLHNWGVEGTDWYGEALMRNAEAAYDDTQVVREAWGQYDVKIAGSHWVIHYPYGVTKINGTDTDNRDIAIQLSATLKTSGTIAIPRQFEAALQAFDAATPDAWKIELIESSGASTISYIERSRYLDVLKCRAFGVPERAVLEGQFGTKAEAQTHGDLAIVIVEMRHNKLCQMLNWHVVNRLLVFNYGPLAEGTVSIQPSPLTDKQSEFYEKIYNLILSQPDGFLTELSEIDLKAIRDKLNVPTLAEEPINPLANLPTLPMLPTLPA